MTDDLASLNKQAIAAAHKYMGHTAWGTVILTFSIVTAFIVHLVLYAQGMVPTWAAILILGVLSYFSYTPLHEAAHRNINGNNEKLRWLNDLCGYLVAPLIGNPYASHSAEHFTHHRYTNQPDKDPDFVISEYSKGFFSWVITTFKFIWVQNAYFGIHKWALATIKERCIYTLELSLSIGWRIVFIVMVEQP